ncbi:MAG: hypothetical protein KDJ65_07745 [Anaerolineae bacterium]|nr:hypothetical protein [Anaerolineae bacterium]
MKKYDITELIKRWEREELTVEQAVGQILLWVGSLSDRVTKLEALQRKSAASPSAEG